MHDNTLKVAIPSQTQIVRRDTQGPSGKAAPVRQQAGDAAAAAGEKAIDKAVADLHIAGDHKAPSVNGPHLAGIANPEKPRKTKSDTLSTNQRAALQESLKALGQVDLAEAVASVKPGKISTLKEPSVLEFIGESGEKQRWIVSNSLREGSFGKFRIAVLDTPEGAPVVVKAIKEYRLEERHATERRLPSVKRRRKALAALEWVERKYPGLRHYVKSMKLDINKLDKPVGGSYDNMLRYLDTKLPGGLAKLPGHIVNHLALATKTSHVTPEAIARENALFPLADSPLQVAESVQLNGRVYNYSTLMRGEFDDVAKSKKLSDEDRKWVVRDAARESVARLHDMHAADLLHRDIKPQNIFVDQEGNAQLGDWNLTVPLKRGKAAGYVGTPHYMAPELFDDRSYGKEVDVYSLALSLAEAALKKDLINFDETYLVDDTRTNTQISTVHETLSVVIEQLVFRKDGTIDPVSLHGLRGNVMLHMPKYEQRRIREVIIKHLDHIHKNITEWNLRDPQMCGAVLNHMMRGDKSRRSDTAPLKELFSKLQPADSAESQRAKQVAKEILGAALPVDEEVKKLQAYAKVYRAEVQSPEA